ncbi:MAG TPA: hypothetical protein DD490_21510 [Acidobacteria bacterium]|nr:hypothetical protein [Acidobacteriota bacterium]
MPYQKYAVVLSKLDLRVKALSANIGEFPHLAKPLAQLGEMLELLRERMAEQARLTAQRQEVSKQVAELSSQAQKLMTFLDAGVRQHYGNRSEMLLAYGLQPFRSKPRVRMVDADGHPVKRTGDDATPQEPE